MQESSKEVVAKFLNTYRPRSILDVPCGKGWLSKRLNYTADIDGIDLYTKPEQGYRHLQKTDLDDGLPKDIPSYDCIVSCEGVEHFANPGLFFRSSYQHLNPGGTLLITTPNIWYPMARLQYLFRGFFPGFPCLVGRIQKGQHMHIMPWSFPQLYLYLTLYGYTHIQLHNEALSHAKHNIEKLFALPQRLYCKRKAQKCTKQGKKEERRFWELCLKTPSLLSNHLIVTAERPSE